ncbi:hypothetical protein Hamer_G012645, partial [Homarus americanus]
IIPPIYYPPKEETFLGWVYHITLVVNLHQEAAVGSVIQLPPLEKTRSRADSDCENHSVCRPLVRRQLRTLLCTHSSTLTYLK